MEPKDLLAAIQEMNKEQLKAVDNMNSKNQDLAATVKEMNEKLKALEESEKKLKEDLAKATNEPANRKQQFDFSGNQAPFVTSGEVGKDSRGYSIARIAQAMLSGTYENAKYEKNVSDILRASNVEPCAQGILVPVDSLELQDIKGLDGLTKAMAQTASKKVRTKALSEGTDSAGGYTVSSVQASEIIDYLKEKSVIERAGARVFPMPKSGQLAIPKLTSGTTANIIGEGSSVTASQPVYSSLNLSVYKLAARTIVSNELLADSTPGVEGIIREELAYSISNGADQLMLYGTGTGQPYGILNTPGINSVTANSPATDGDTLTGEDFYNMLEAVMTSKEGDFNAWVMHPKTYFRALKLRAGGYAAGDGQFLFDMGRGIGGSLPREFMGFPVYTTTNMPVNHVKGASTNLTAFIGGNFREAIIGRKSVLELSVSKDLNFDTYQTNIMAIYRFDFGLRTPASFAVMDKLIQ